jgi:hypothetical protein
VTTGELWGFIVDLCDPVLLGATFGMSIGRSSKKVFWGTEPMNDLEVTAASTGLDGVGVDTVVVLTGGEFLF